MSISRAFFYSFASNINLCLGLVGRKSLLGRFGNQLFQFPHSLQLLKLLNGSQLLPGRLGAAFLKNDRLVIAGPSPAGDPDHYLGL